MRTEQFWVTVQQMGEMTKSTCRVMESQGQASVEFEKEQIQHLITKCQRQLLVLSEEVALNRGNGLTPSEKSCEEFSHKTTSKEKQ